MKEIEYMVGLVGGSGMLGREIVAVLEAREFPCSRVVAFVESDDDLPDLTFREEDVPLEYLRDDVFMGMDLVFFAGEGDMAQKWAPAARRSGCAVVNCSTGGSDDPVIPVVACGINDDVLDDSRTMATCPGVTSLQLASVLKPLHDACRVKRVVVSTYQAVSHKGQPGVEELENQLRRLLNYQEAESGIFPYQIAFNCLPHMGTLQEDEYTSEEDSLIRETRMLLGNENVPITATACLIPTLFGNGFSVNIETVEDCTPQTARGILSQTEGVAVFDNPGEQVYPMPLVVSGQDDVFVGRIRKDVSVEHGLNLWIVGDNIRNMAVNAVRVGEFFLKK